MHIVKHREPTRTKPKPNANNLYAFLFVSFAFFVSVFLSTSAAAIDPPSPPDLRRAHGTGLDSDERRCPLAATLVYAGWREAGEKFPALLEYLPYRKDDGTAAGTIRIMLFLRGADMWGRAWIFVALAPARASRRSANIPNRNRKDGEQVIAWLAHQPWSNGNVGMFGISWGGFNALQMAMRHAPELEGDSRGQRHCRIIPR